MALGDKPWYSGTIMRDLFFLLSTLLIANIGRSTWNFGVAIVQGYAMKCLHLVDYVSDMLKKKIPEVNLKEIFDFIEKLMSDGIY